MASRAPDAAAVPDHLYRVYSDQSNGTNSALLFAPASAGDAGRDEICAAGVNNEQGSLRDLLRSALLGQPMAANPFIFFTRSLLFALQLAAYKRAQGDTSIYIACVKTSTTTTPDAHDNVAFRRASELMDEHGVELRNRSDGASREYADVFITTYQTVQLGAGSSGASFDKLIDAGLHMLYPELLEVTKRHNVRLNLTVVDLRTYWFQKQYQLTDEAVTTAARLAALFEPSSAVNCDSLLQPPKNLMMGFVALRKRSLDDPVLNNWIDRRSATETVSDPRSRYIPMKLTGLPEVDQYQSLMQWLGHREMHRGCLNGREIRSEVVEKEIADWTSWRRQSRNEHRAERAERTGLETRSERRHSHRAPRCERFEGSVRSNTRVEKPRRQRSDSYVPDGFRRERDTGPRREGRQRR